MLEVGDKFESFEEFHTTLKEYEKAVFNNYWVRDSKSLKTHGSRFPESVSAQARSELGYYYIRIACIKGGRDHVPRNSRRKTLTFRQGCQAGMFLKISSCGQYLTILELNEDHNHPVSETLFNTLAHQRLTFPPHQRNAKNKPAAVQISAMIDHLENHTDLALGRFIDADGEKSNSTGHWKELTLYLNMIGPRRSEQQWQKTWSELTTQAKQAANEVEQRLMETGEADDVCPMHRKILAILSKESSFESDDPKTPNTSPRQRKRRSVLSSNKIPTKKGSHKLETKISNREAKPNADQLMALVDMLIGHEELPTFRLTTTSRMKGDLDYKWEEIVEHLNSLGSKLTPIQWQYVWYRMKISTQRFINHRQTVLKFNRGAKLRAITPLEKKIIKILRPNDTEALLEEIDTIPAEDAVDEEMQSDNEITRQELKMETLGDDSHAFDKTLNDLSEMLPNIAQKNDIRRVKVKRIMFKENTPNIDTTAPESHAESPEGSSYEAEGPYVKLDEAQTRQFHYNNEQYLQLLKRVLDLEEKNVALSERQLKLEEKRIEEDNKRQETLINILNSILNKLK